MNPKRLKKLTESIPQTRDRWQVTYSGFILMLLCFFIMLCSFSMTDSSKAIRFVRSISTGPDILTGGKRFDKNERVLPEAPDMVDHRSGMAGIQAEIQQIVNSLHLDKEIGVSMSAAGILLRFSDSVLFQSGYADVMPEAQFFLKKVCAVIVEKPYDVHIEGHTDTVPIKNERFPSNWELSAARAINVMRHIMQTAAMPADRLSAAGFGEFRPLFPNDSDVNRARNRRVEIYLVPSETRERLSP